MRLLLATRHHEAEFALLQAGEARASVAIEFRRFIPLFPLLNAVRTLLRCRVLALADATTQAESGANIQMLPISEDTKWSMGPTRTACGVAIGSRPEIDRALQHSVVQLSVFSDFQQRMGTSFPFPFRQLYREEISGLQCASNRRNSDEVSKAYS
jgi:hypothetical protein